MANTDYDVIIIGAGIAGCCCATLCARAGLSVLLLERATQPGGKNLSGGKLYSYAFDAIFPQFSRTAPVERQITHEKLTALATRSATTVEYLHHDENAFSVLRGRLDPWLFAEAERAGAQCLASVQVDGLIKENGAVSGVRIDGETLTAKAVAISEGANTLLAEQHQLVKKLPEHAVAIGVKEVLSLPRGVLEDRFSLEGNAGTAWLFTGGVCADKPAGGFIYTNQETLSVGIVCPLASLRGTSTALPTLLDNFKQHSVLRPLLHKAELMEYGAHLIPECGLEGVPDRLGGRGYLLMGDSARFCVNTGLTIRGMDLAALSAQAAAQTLIETVHEDSNSDLHDLYRQHLTLTGLWALMKHYQKTPRFLQNPALFSVYPEMLAAIQREIYCANATPPPRLTAILWRHIRQFGLNRLFRDMVEGGRSL